MPTGTSARSFVAATLALADGESLYVAPASEQGVALLGPFAATQRVPPARG